MEYSEFKVRIALFGCDDVSQKTLEDLVHRHADSGEPDAQELEVVGSCSAESPSDIGFTTTVTGIDWDSWLQALVDAARKLAGKTCRARMEITEVRTSDHRFDAEAAKLEEYVVGELTLRTVRRKVTAKDQADAVARIAKGEGLVLDEKQVTIDASRWPVEICRPACMGPTEEDTFAPVSAMA